jgi:C1A family cysteine protease
MKVISLTALVFLSFTVLAKPGVDYKEVQNAIDEQNADWTADETWISELPLEDSRKFFGAEDAPIGKLNEGTNSKSLENSTPEELDWRNYKNENWLTPIKNQANCGSCVAFASIATAEAMFTISSGNTAYKPILSTQNLFSCGGGLCDKGWTTIAGAKRLKDVGVVDQACVPYVSGSTGKDEACTTTCPDAKKRIKKISDYKLVGSVTKTYSSANKQWNYSVASTIREIKAALKKGPLLTSMTVYADLMAYKSGIYKHVTGEKQGGHAVSIVGFSDSGRYWIMRNSWGETWGEKGYAKISWDDESGLGKTSFSMAVVPEKEFLNINAPVSKKFYAQMMPYKIATSSMLKKDITLILRNEAGQVYDTFKCESFSGIYCQGNIDTTVYPDGKYELTAELSKNTGNYMQNSTSINAVPVYFFVSNNEPQAVVNFNLTPYNTDFTQPVKGYVEMDLNMDFQTLPFESLKLLVVDLEGKEVYSKEYEEVYKKMRVGFRSTNIPNGKYKLRIAGKFPYDNKIKIRRSRFHEITIKNDIRPTTK